jgi:NADH-quinone oxidoreductase subunit I
LLFKGALRALWSFSRRPYYKPLGGWNSRALMPSLVRDGERCDVCFLCAATCPTQCIELQAGLDKQGQRERVPRQFSIDMGRCVNCGLCAQACPVAALEMVDATSAVSGSRSALRWELVPSTN